MIKDTDISSSYWLDYIAADIAKLYKKDPIIVSSGVAPSGEYHIGHLREIITTDAIVWSLRRLNRKAIHLHFVDDMDALRKIPVGISADFNKYLGQPVYLIPDPWGCHDSYSMHFFARFRKFAIKIGIDIDDIRFSHKEYGKGKFTSVIEKSLESIPKIKKIIYEISGRKLNLDWAPIQILSDNNRLDEWSYKALDKQTKTIAYNTVAGSSGQLDYTKGKVKLDWRLDWPARWSIYDVNVEPFGRDHATKGGSYDTGKVLTPEIFADPAPYPVPYDFINLSGDTKKMSSSRGTGLTLEDALAILPAEVLKYFVIKSRPSKRLYFDTGIGFYNLLEEFSKIEEAKTVGSKHEFEDAYNYSISVVNKQQDSRIISSVPFSHLVAVYQAARGNFNMVIEILKRTGFELACKSELAILKNEVKYVRNWLEKYAPEDIKFEVQPKLSSSIKITNQQKQFLTELANRIEKEKDLTGQAIHDLIYSIVQVLQIKPNLAFQAIYLVVLGKESGPKAGWFLASLDCDWLIKRLKLLK